MPIPTSAKQELSLVLSWLHRALDALVTWVTQLSWGKFFLFVCLLFASGGILHDVFWGDEEEVRHSDKATHVAEAAVTIDDTGIHITKPPTIRKKHAATPGEDTDDNDDGSGDAAGGKSKDGAVAKPAAPALPSLPSIPAAPATPAPPAPPTSAGDVHIDLPPQVSAELSNAIEAAVDNAAESRAKTYHKQASNWFMSFLVVVVMALFGIKALAGGKKRAEAEMHTANAAAERESMQRQLSEAKMQAMQAQVEPHFLFNTLASVEHLIETDPPRASAMQRSLIQYLRAVLPQMRNNNLMTNLGREVDMVTSYLELLKMRMEERLCVQIRVPDGLRSAAFPPMMLQSLVENAIKHGLECKPEGGTLSLSAEIVDSLLRVTVADDGVGFGVMPSTGTGLGLTNIRERLKLLHGDRGQLRIAPSAGGGVVATIEVPYQLAAK
jgi:hypothetical protein